VTDLLKIFFLFSQEDEQLSAYVQSLSSSDSSSNVHIGLEDDTGRVKAPVKAFVAIATRLHRTAKQCRERWKNYLRDGIKKGDWTMQEEELIRDLYQTFGSRCVQSVLPRVIVSSLPHAFSHSWSSMAKLLPNRSDNDIKNKWHAMRNKERRLEGIVEGIIGGYNYGTTTTMANTTTNAAASTNHDDEDINDHRAVEAAAAAAMDDNNDEDNAKKPAAKKSPPIDSFQHSEQDDDEDDASIW
jgi:Myb-like DNA-binding domain